MKKKIKMTIICSILAFGVCFSAARHAEGHQTEDNRKEKIQNTKENPPNPLLILVNRTHMLSKDYQVSLHTLKSGRCAVAEEMYEDLCRMLTAGSQEGCSFVIASGYRSRERQKELLEEDIRNLMDERNMTYEQAWEESVKETMPPGCSEHETGLAVDIVSAEYQILDEGQEDTAEYQWLKENCWKYGFILRYPSDKTDITGINYEPWHFRYVGAEAAQEITEQGLTLEEYICYCSLRDQ